MYYYKTIYTKGEKGHVHIGKYDLPMACYQKHRKPDYFKFWIAVIGLVELIIIFALINKAW